MCYIQFNNSNTYITHKYQTPGPMELYVHLKRKQVYLHHMRIQYFANWKKMIIFACGIRKIIAFYLYIIAS